MISFPFRSLTSCSGPAREERDIGSSGGAAVHKVAPTQSSQYKPPPVVFSITCLYPTEGYGTLRKLPPSYLLCRRTLRKRLESMFPPVKYPLCASAPLRETIFFPNFNTCCQNGGRLKTVAQNAVKTTLGLFYPEVCALCQDEPATVRDGFVGAKCRQQVRFVRPPFCHRCGLPFEGDLTTSFECTNCREMELY